MTWPLASDYQDAVQNPMQCFQDPELKAGQVALNRLGLPRVASGMFASVYEIRNGPHKWAVRCFLRPSADQQNRYALLSQYLNSLSMAGVVGFDYEPQGIRVRGQWYPIVKMEWVEGQTLHTYIAKHVKEADTLRKLARQWRILVERLRQNFIAHADLQHGNVMVTPNGELRLVDYDGMFVPSLRGQGSHELGHPNYQHPQRTAQSYDEHLDNFAALVIYTSLVALIYDLSLWDKFHTGENLIFSASDFKAPQKSAVFERLYHSSEELVRDLSQRLALACEGHIGRVPDFGQLVAALPDLPEPLPWWKHEDSHAAQSGSDAAHPSNDAAHSGRTQLAHDPAQPPASAPTGSQPPRKAPAPHVPTAGSASTAHAPVSSAPVHPPAHTAANSPSPVPGHQPPDAPPEDDPGWWKPPADSATGKALNGFLKPLVNIFFETAPAPAKLNAPVVSAPPVPMQKGIPRTTAKKRRVSPWMTCSSITCLFACLTLFGAWLLVKAGVEQVQHWLEPNTPSGPASRTVAPPADKPKTTSHHKSAAPLP